MAAGRTLTLSPCGSKLCQSTFPPQQSPPSPCLPPDRAQQLPEAKEVVGG